MKLMKTAPPAKVYRGLDESNGRELPPMFFKGDFAGGVELAFSSTTEDYDTAVRYSGGKDSKGTILELEFDAVSRGASIKFLSQYPAEEEWLWPPCTNLTCSSVRYPEGAKKIVNVRATVAQKCPGVSHIVTCTSRPASTLLPPLVIPEVTMQ
jgi:hypothetical protein